ncbi:aminopeptidase N [Caulobacter sp. S45]|uniref:aminopeptidase N n=1 Tax=Caulobacter sp. S45 TaxID=1641861 RepID=UPI0015751AFD|nr:aminopeptidase N [Caulobacter sp. S45]
MRTEQPVPLPIRLEDYAPPAFRVEAVRLELDLQPSATRVRARLELRRDGGAAAPLVLDGVRLKLLAASVDGRTLAPADYTQDAETLTIPGVPDAFVLETEVQIDPQGNTALEGLYMSGGRFCTQCEAEGFRKITFFPDRPDVLTRYTVRLEADASTYPRLLSNGNLVAQGRLDGDRHFAVWNDPFPKPCYLFAAVAGELDELADSFVTLSGREVRLSIYVDPGQSARAEYAMDALKRAMRFDETAFGREYDLDLFMIVAVRDFNFGAMENKGLNIFNSSLLLADPETATDADYERIESVVAHEYFHNWTGNRITCRDWFQLCLKEGLTVFRDQAFSAQERGAAVQRIKDVRALRTRQFAEDAGPLAHPVRPSSYLKIDNFYTATIYEKGAEIIRMLSILLGEADFRRGLDLYFDRWDGTATTVEAFLACFAETSGRDLSSFMTWYEQPGTPRLAIEALYDEAAEVLDLTLRQTSSGGPDRPGKPLPIPVKLGLLDGEGAAQAFRLPGADAPTREATLVLDGAEMRVRLEGVARLPVLSALRNFSAPVVLGADAPPREGYVLLAADPDLFNRWEAGQALARELILARVRGQPDEVNEARFAEALGHALQDEAADNAFKALLLELPGEADLASALAPHADPTLIHIAREALRACIAVHLSELLTGLHGALQSGDDFSPEAAGAGRRALRIAALDMLVADPHAANQARASGHFDAAANMTDAMGGLSALSQIGGAPFDAALAAFYTRWKSEPLVVDKWFAVQARAPGEETVGRVLGLTAHPAFDPRTPNRLRALVVGFSVANPFRFHAPDGAGYRFLADQVLSTDAFNPTLAARLVGPLGDHGRYRSALADQMRGQLERIVGHTGLSRNVAELAVKALGV